MPVEQHNTSLHEPENSQERETQNFQENINFSEPSVELPDFKANFQRIKQELSEVEAGIEVYALLFAVCKKFLHIEKGAILLKDDSQEFFIPWSITGYDKTTEHRLRLDNSFIDALNRHGENLDIQDIYPLQRYFSTREYAVLKNILIFPLVYQNQHLGVLIISESPLIHADSETINRFSDIFLEKAAELIYNSRFSKMSQLGSPVNKLTGNLETEIRNVLETAQENNKQVLAMSVVSGNLIEFITSANPDIDEFRIKKDILRILNSVVASQGKVFEMQNGNILLLLVDESGIDGDIIIHQLKIALKQLFGNTERGELPIESKWSIYPKHADDIDTLLQSIEINKS
ncbi:MAG: hypothetical protein ACLFR1_11910 [Spirochaetia bacterium]